MKRFRTTFLFFALACGLAAQIPEGSVTGSIVEPSGQRPVEAAAVTLRNQADGKVVRSATTDARGAFDLKGLAFGRYELSFGPSGGFETPQTAPFMLSAAQPAVNLGPLLLQSNARVVTMEAVEVSTRKEAFYNSLDRKVYDVAKDVTSTTGSTSDLLKNVPSVDVDVEGNVSLRGDSGVQILVNGKPSTMMNGRNRAAVLEQMPADSIERIEVITNPSAKYKPDGTGGIINLVMKQRAGLAQAGSLRVNLGNDERYNAGVAANGQWGNVTLHGNLSVRQDDRGRLGREERLRFDAAGKRLGSTQQDSTSASRPFSRVAQLGVEYAFGEETKLGATVSYHDRKSQTNEREVNVTRDAAGTITRDFERLRRGPESEDEFEAELRFEHTFAGGERELTAELSHGTSREDAHDLATETSRLGATAVTSDAKSQRDREVETDFSFDYVHPLAAGAKFELGYEFEREKSDGDFRASVLDPISGQWATDPQTTNRFIHDSTINAMYATFGRPLGRFGFLAGLRYEHAAIKTRQFVGDVRASNQYGRVYPSLHLSYRLTDAQQFQLSYSHRVNRPDGDDLNPFPEYDDPFDRHAGNPQLVPEDTHSIEGGYQFQSQGTTYLASLYLRQRYHGITEVSRYIDANTLLTTPENLATNRSAGLELGVTRRVGNNLSLNFSGNVYRNEIDAANLGLGRRRTAMAWDAKLNTNWDATDHLTVQFTTSYRARRLTAQGERRPSAVANLGLRYELKGGKTALIATISDVFNSANDRATIDTPLLKGETMRRRSSRIFYIGMIYNFGKAAKNSKDDLQFDESI